MRFGSVLTLAMLIAYIDAQSTTTTSSGTTTSTSGTTTKPAGTTSTTTGTTAATTTTVDVTTPDDPAVKKAWVDKAIKDA
jgi:hypothetical protein